MPFLNHNIIKIGVIKPLGRVEGLVKTCSGHVHTFMSTQEHNMQNTYNLYFIERSEHCRLEEPVDKVPVEQRAYKLILYQYFKQGLGRR